MIDPFRFAPWVSVEAAALFSREVVATKDPGREVAVLRAHYDTSNRRLLDDALRRYQVAHHRDEVAGIGVHVVTPAGGAVRTGTLLCLHGGAFMWGRGAGALLEAVPVAAATGMTVLAVEYALAPEHGFPQAVEDVLAVYRAVRGGRPAEGVGIYGCSAGGILASQAVARLIVDGEPVPEAIAMLCGTGLEFEGDSAMVTPALSGQPDPGNLRLEGLPYFADVDLRDPVALPGCHPRILAGFPASLLVTGSRDFAASAITVMHRRLVAAGVDARLLHFDGMWHAFHMATTLPEAEETFAAMAAFFGAHLT